MATETEMATGTGCRDGEGGFTLVELLVAMSLVGVLVTIFMSGVVQMTKATVRVQNASNSADEARRVFDRFDRQVRSATEVNYPALVGNTWYLEFRAPSSGSTPLCTQWRLDTTADVMQTRTWDDVASPVASAWTTIGSRVINDPVTQPPFGLTSADSTYTRQRVSLWVVVSNGQPGGVQVAGTVVARNTSTATVTNLLTTSGGVTSSVTQVCQLTAGWRP